MAWEMTPYVRDMLARGGPQLWDWAFKQGAENIMVQLGDYDGALIGLDAGGLGAIAAGALPVVLVAGVAMALGAGYEQARELVQNEESLWGFAEGFVMGILGWEWRNVLSLFYRHGVVRVYQTDEALNTIRVQAYDTGLKVGYVTGYMLPASVKDAFVKGLRKLAGHPSSNGWSRNVQVSFVISLAAVFRRFVQP